MHMACPSGHVEPSIAERERGHARPVPARTVPHLCGRGPRLERAPGALRWAGTVPLAPETGAHAGKKGRISEVRGSRCWPLCGLGPLPKESIDNFLSELKF